MDFPALLRTPAGHAVTIAPAERSERWKGDPLWSEMYSILVGALPAGALYRSMNYSREGEAPRWTGSLSPLRGRLLRWGERTPYGIGFDVAAFDTVEECFAAWASNADALIAYASKRTP